MRLLIYLLALMSGFSAAEAARADVAQASSLSQTAVAVSEAMVALETDGTQKPADVSSRARQNITAQFKSAVLPSETPVSRKDLVRE